MVASESDKAFVIGEWTLIPALNLLRQGGRDVRLEPRHADLLAFLAARAGEVVSAEEILARVWSGMVVTDQSVYQAIAKLRKALGDDAGQATYIETVPKRGYRLIAPTRPIEPQPGPTEAGPLGRLDRIGTLASAPFKQRAFRGVALGAILVLAFALWLGLRPGPTPSPEQAHWSLVVLPFASLSTEDSDTLIAQGFAIELADQLAHIPEIQVIGPASSQAISAGPGSMRQGAERVDADILVSGRLRRDGGRLRISASLTDGRSGEQVWTQRFDRADGNTFETQESVAVGVAKALKDHLKLNVARVAPLAGSDDRRAYDAFLLGQHYRTNRSAASLKRARDFFQQAVELDPGFLAAKRDLATTQLLLSFYGDLPLREALELAQPLLKDCLGSAGDDAQILGALGLQHALNGAHGLAEDYLRRAVARAPNYVEGWMWLGLAERQQGRLADALAAFRHAKELEPLMVTAVINYGNALIWSGQPDQARQEVQRLTASVKDHPQLYRVQSNILLEAGDLVGAYRSAREALALDPADALSKANMAMVLAHLGQEEEARAIAAPSRSARRRGRATQLYLDRMTLCVPDPAPANLDQLYDAQLKDSPNLPEIDWRLSNARMGLAAYFAGDLRQAREHLDRSLSGRADPIERTDYDLFLCTSLLDAERRLGDQRATSRGVDRCEAGFTTARQAGWRSLAIEYVGVRLAVLNGRPDDAMGQLDALVDRGFRNGRLLALDPVLDTMRGQPRFGAIQRRVEDAVGQARRDIGIVSNCTPSGAVHCQRGDQSPPTQALAGR